MVGVCRCERGTSPTTLAVDDGVRGGGQERVVVQRSVQNGIRILGEQVVSRQTPVNNPSRRNKGSFSKPRLAGGAVLCREHAGHPASGSSKGVLVDALSC